MNNGHLFLTFRYGTKPTSRVIHVELLRPCSPSFTLAFDDATALNESHTGERLSSVSAGDSEKDSHAARKAVQHCTVG